MIERFRKRLLDMPQIPEVAKVYSYRDSTIYINRFATPGANIVMYEAPTGYRGR